MSQEGAPRVKPHSPEAEQAVLCSILMGSEAKTSCLEFLAEEDFYEERNKVIFRAMRTLNAENSAIDLITLSNCMKKQNTLDGAGGMEYLGQVATATPTSVNARHYAQIVKDKATYRRFINIGEEMANQAYNEGLGVDELSDKVEKDVFHALSSNNTGDFTPISDALIDTYAQIQENAKSKGGITGIASGFTDLDRITAGFQKSDLILLGARPSMGKTAFGLNCVEYAAVHEKKTCAIFSLEMSKTQVASRLLCSAAMVNAENVRKGQLEPSEWNQIAAALGPLSKANIYINDMSGITLPQMRTMCRKLKLERGLDMVLVDYLQLMSSDRPGGGENRQNEISEISRGLKGLARELEIPVLALSQLSRNVENRSDKRPILADLRESGAIEQDADVVMFLYRDEYYTKEKTTEPGIAKLTVAKQRNGGLGTIELAWRGMYTKFDNYLHSGQPAPSYTDQ